MAIRAVMFDLDGTLLDTLGDLSASANHALAALDRPTHEPPAYRRFVGRGVHQLFVDALGTDAQHLVDDAVTLFLAWYKDHQFDSSTPYPGITDMLDALERQQLGLAILSNKPDPATQTVVGHYFGDRPWLSIRGHRQDTPPKPDPMGAQQTFEATGIDAAQWAYVGDSDVDMQTGKRAGMYTIGVSWGFRDADELSAHGADAVVDHPSDLVTLILARA